MADTTLIDTAAIADSLPADARSVIAQLQGRKRRPFFVVNDGPASEAFHAAKRGAEELVSLGLCEAPIQLPTDDLRLVAKWEYRWTETGARVRNEILNQIERKRL